MKIRKFKKREIKQHNRVFYNYVFKKFGYKEE